MEACLYLSAFLSCWLWLSWALGMWAWSSHAKNTASKYFRTCSCVDVVALLIISEYDGCMYVMVVQDSPGHIFQEACSECPYRFEGRRLPGGDHGGYSYLRNPWMPTLVVHHMSKVPVIYIICSTFLCLLMQILFPWSVSLHDSHTLAFCLSFFNYPPVSCHSFIALSKSGSFNKHFSFFV